MVDASAQPALTEAAPVADPLAAPESQTFDATESPSATYDAEEAVNPNVRLSRVESQTLKENSTQKTLEGTRVSQRSSHEDELPLDHISNAKIRAAPAKQIRPAQANAASHAALGEPSDGSGEYE